MKNSIFKALFVVAGWALFSACASVQTWPDDATSADSKMVAIQGKIGDGLKSGALTPDQSQMYLSTLKVIRTDHGNLRDQRVPREEWNALHARIDRLDNEIDRGFARTPRIDELRSGDRVMILQRRIDEGRISGRLPPADGRAFQGRLDSIRNDSSRVTQGGRAATHDESIDISGRLDSLEMELNRYR